MIEVSILRQITFCYGFITGCLLYYSVEQILVHLIGTGTKELYIKELYSEFTYPATFLSDGGFAIGPQNEQEISLSIVAQKQVFFVGARKKHSVYYNFSDCMYF